MQRFRAGLGFKAHRLVYHSTLGLRVIKKKKIRLRHSQNPNPQNAGPYGVIAALVFLY